jgi:hypothetical protein
MSVALAMPIIGIGIGNAPLGIAEPAPGASTGWLAKARKLASCTMMKGWAPNLARQSCQQGHELRIHLALVAVRLALIPCETGEGQIAQRRDHAVEQAGPPAAPDPWLGIGLAGLRDGGSALIGRAAPRDRVPSSSTT